MQEKYELYLIFVAGTAVVLLLVATVLGVVSLHTRERLKYLLQLERVQAEARERQTQAIIQTSELEQERIAKDLHDDLGPLLAGVRLQLAAVHATLTDAHTRPIIGEVMGQLEAALKNIRAISRNLYPLELENRDFNELVSGYIARLQHAEAVQVAVALLPDPIYFSKEKSLAAYRIFSELVLNALRHSGAVHISISLRIYENTLVLSVTDDGIGLQVPHTEGIGLNSIRARAEFIGAKLALAPNTPTGLISMLSIPLS